MSSRILYLLILLLSIANSGCTPYQKNVSLTQFNPEKGYRYEVLNTINGEQNTDSLFVVVSFSGGGTRAAAFSYGVLKELQNTQISWKGEQKSLLEEVDIISSVSGGSFTSAYYGLFREAIFDGSYETKFLKHDVQKALIWKLANPLSWFKLASPDFGRSDLANEYYQEHIFGKKTFKDLQSNGKPFVMMNGTDMTTGAQFPIIQDQFDLLCSDLDKYPVSRAVATSSAFPGLLTPLTYNNYAGSCAYEEPLWVSNGINDEFVNPERYNFVDERRSYYDPAPYQPKRDYVHMMDGGVADNIGLRSVTFGLENTGPGYSIMQKVNNKEIEKLVLIIVNAATDPVNDLDQSASVPGFITSILTASTVPLDNYTFDTINRAKVAVNAYSDDVKLIDACNNILLEQCPDASPIGKGLTRIDSYISNISFNHIKDAEERYWFKNLPTNFGLPSETIDKLTNTGIKLLKQSKEYQALLKDIGI